MELFKKQLQEAREQEPEEIERGTPYFRSYYQGYELREVVGEDGIERNEFVYTGKLYRLDAPKGTRGRNKCLHLALLAVSVACIALGGTQSAMVNTSRIGMAPMFILILLTVLRLSAIVFYCISPQRLKEWDYKRGVRHLCEYALFCAVCSSVAAVMGVVFWLLFADVPSLVSAALQVPCGLAALASRHLERKAPWQAVPARDTTG